MRVCETVLDPAAADWVHETMGECPATGCPFVPREDRDVGLVLLGGGKEPGRGPLEFAAPEPRRHGLVDP